MRILILGSDYSARKFFNLANNEKNIVFSCVKDCNYIEFENFKDIFDFIEANEINFVLILDEKYISNDLIKELIDMNISVLSASEENIELLKSKSNLKRFIYKNKILTPKFQIFEKPQSAIDFVYSTHQAYAIKPDNSSYQECVQFAKSRTQAQKIINKFFENGNKKILIEDYIEGKNVCFWALSNGYSAKIIGTCAKYQDNLSYFEPEFIDEKFKNNILDNVINPVITSFSLRDDEYCGILGFDFMINSKQEAYLVGIKSFFDELDIELILKAYDFDWFDVFEATLTGDVFSKYDFVPYSDYMLSIRQNEEIHLISARTLGNLELYLNELGFDIEEYKQACKIWKN